MKKPIDAIVMNPKDNVAVALHAIRGDSSVAISVGTDILIHNVSQDIPSGHKFALCSIHPEEEIIKYGETIGKATADIGDGEHVHVHNLASQRGRGDLKQ